MKGHAALAHRLWSGQLGRAGRLFDAALVPAEALYRVGVATRNQAYSRGLLPARRAPLPVISVGNIAVGGSGKTPFAAWLVDRLLERGQRPALIHGGYADDEPELHRLWHPDVPVIVNRDRVRAVAAAHALGASVVVLDDAFQHRRLQRDLDLVLVSAERWSEHTRLLPRGPWREPVMALRRAGVVVCVRRTADADHAAHIGAQLARLSQRPVASVHLSADRWNRAGTTDSAPAAPAVLVAGIAEPELFAANARAAGAAVATELIFADHHAYTSADAELITAAAAGRPIVTTAKDWVKLRAWLEPEEAYVLEQRVIVTAGGTQLAAALDRVLQ